MMRIPKRFYDDHCERDLEAPEILKETKAHYWVAVDDNVLELLADVHFYSDRSHFDQPHLFGLVTSAIATAKAIEKHLIDEKIDLLVTQKSA